MNKDGSECETQKEKGRVGDHSLRITRQQPMLFLMR